MLSFKFSNKKRCWMQLSDVPVALISLFFIYFLYKQIWRSLICLKHRRCVTCYFYLISDTTESSIAEYFACLDYIVNIVLFFVTTFPAFLKTRSDGVIEYILRQFSLQSSES